MRAIDVRERLSDMQARPEELAPGPSQRSGLAPSQAAVAEHVDEGLELIRDRLCEPVQILGIKEAHWLG